MYCKYCKWFYLDDSLKCWDGRCKENSKVVDITNNNFGCIYFEAKKGE